MKKVMALVLTAVMLMSVAVFSVGAVSYEQPFDKGTLGSECFRIPALYTLNDGSVMAAADIRYGHGSDSPQNIDITVAVSKDGYTGWDYSIVNRFDDYKDGVTDKNSASFIDAALAQSKTTDRIFIITDVFPSGGGYPTAKTGTGFATIDGVSRMLLTDGSSSDSLDSFDYYIGEYENGMAKVYHRGTTVATEYTVDAEYRLYKNGTALYMTQNGSEEQVQQNVYYSGAELKCYMTAYLWLRYSDDNGESWSAPINISGQVKKSGEAFLGICPGRGLVTEYEGKERVIFLVYDDTGIAETVTSIYSDDNGITWQRGPETSFRLGVGKTSETQVIEMNYNGETQLRAYARNSSNYVAYAQSTDGGVTWGEFQADKGLEGTANCMVSFINTSKKINGYEVVLGSMASNTSARADGVIRVGLIKAIDEIEWISQYRINDGFFAYSCLTELADGKFGILYEDEAAHISYMIFTVSDSGEVNEINGENNEYTEDTPTFWQKFVNFFKNIFNKILMFFDWM